MSGAVLDRPRIERFELDGGVTLEELLNATLKSARTTGSSECPVCHARMTYTPAGANCQRCGSRLS